MAQPNSDEPTGDPYQPRRSTSRRSSIANMVRRLSREFEDSSPPEGLAAVASGIASTIAAEHPQPHHASQAHQHPSTLNPDKGTELVERVQSSAGNRPAAPSEDTVVDDSMGQPDQATEPFENGYHFPPKYPWQEATKQGLLSFWKFFITPMGFFWTIYGLNVVAWGGMLFLLLCNAAPAMCYPTCDDIDSPRRKWVEWDSQILTALFCVPAFGLAPWRFRDFWYLLKYRFKGDQSGLRRLAGYHAGWFRLKGSQDLDPVVGAGNIPDDVPKECLPIPEDKTPVPLTGTRAPPTAVWKLDFAVWSMVLNTFAQCALCGIMWGMNRYDRPSWTTGFLVAIACLIAMFGGYVMFLEGKKVKSIEGVPLSQNDEEKLANDRDRGVHHYNNIKDKKPKHKQQDVEK